MRESFKRSTIGDSDKRRTRGDSEETKAEDERGGERRADGGRRSEETVRELRVDEIQRERASERRREKND